MADMCSRVDNIKPLARGRPRSLAAQRIEHTYVESLTDTEPIPIKCHPL
jgi:hypothetical protein